MLSNTNPTKTVGEPRCSGRVSRSLFKNVSYIWILIHVLLTKFLLLFRRVKLLCLHWNSLFPLIRSIIQLCHSFWLTIDKLSGTLWHHQQLQTNAGTSFTIVKADRWLSREKKITCTETKQIFECLYAR